MSKMLFSVIIPTFNRYGLGLLGEAIDSVLNQEHRGFTFELIVVDDATPGFKSSTLLDRHPEKNLQVLSLKKNLGTPGAIRQGILKASGEYIVILGDDDLLPKSSLQKRADFIKKNPGIDWFYGKTQLIDSKGKPMRTISQSESFDDFHYARMFLYNYIQGGTTTVKKSVYDQIEWPTWLTTRDDDFIAFELVRPDKYKFSYIDEVLYNYRSHGLTERESEKNLKDIKRLEEIDRKIRYELHDQNLAFLADKAKKAAFFEAEFKERNQRLEKIYTSPLWRLTTPMRKVKNLIKKYL